MNICSVNEWIEVLREVPSLQVLWLKCVPHKPLSFGYCLEKGDSYIRSIHSFPSMLEMFRLLHILKIICLEVEDLIKNLGEGILQEKWSVGQVSAR